MLTNYDLENLCQYYNVPLVGCFMKNELPKKYTKGNYIINLESAPSGGSHWTSCIVQDKNAMYCDSFGGPPVEEMVDMIRSKKGTHLGYNNVVVQNMSSKNCGYYSLCFLLYVTKSPLPLYKAANEYINHFVGNTLENDSILAELLTTLTSSKPQHRLIKRLCREKCVTA
jgi:hypothetical protein